MSKMRNICPLMAIWNMGACLALPLTAAPGQVNAATPAEIQAYIDKVDASRIRTRVCGETSGGIVVPGSGLVTFGTRSVKLAAFAGTPSGHVAAAEYIAGQFASMGYTPAIEDFRVVTDADIISDARVGVAYEKNVVATKIGTVYPNEFIEFTGHFDGYGPGADDNASGTASVLELAQVLKDYPSRCSMRFIALGAEEMNRLAWGAMEHIRLSKEAGEQIRCALNMDTTGTRGEDGNYMAHLWYRSPKAYELTRMFAAVSAQHNLGIWSLAENPGEVVQADEKAYWYNGLLAITSLSSYDRFYGASPNYKYLVYHTSRDACERSGADSGPHDEFSPASIAAFAKANLALGLTLDGFEPNWFSAQSQANDRIRGDFNGDGVDDLIIVTNDGSFEYLGDPSGGFTSNVWARTDLKKGYVEYKVGNFNGDGADDLIIVTNDGSSEYLGNSSGVFKPDVWARTDLRLGNVDYAVGDFSGDGADDLIITTGGGSFEYLGNPNGIFTPDVWAHLALKRGNVEYTVGEFSGDGADDLIITTDGGSYEYLGNPNGGFTPDAWAHLGLTRGNVEYTVGEFSGDGVDDLIITINGGSFEYLGNLNGGFEPDVWWRSDLTRANVSYASGDFNGDGRSDLIITIDGGSYEYLGNLNGGFTPDCWHRPSIGTRFPTCTVGDFDGNGTSDLIVQESWSGTGSSEYLGSFGPSGGLAPSGWNRSDLTIETADYY